MSVLKYLKQELGFGSAEWVELSDEEKQWYKDAARAEMAVLGIEAA